jgi:hypothetical protein
MRREPKSRQRYRGACDVAVDPACPRHPRQSDILTDHGAVVRAYIRRHRQGAREEFASFRDCRSLREAIRVAALSETSDKKRHPHQRRIPGATLRRAQRVLQSASGRLRRCRSFSSLHETVNATIRPLRGIGGLAVYDIATRIGAFLGLEPKLIYLHAGTADGARSLGFSGATMEVRHLPRAYWALKPREVEDCLCIFKQHLARLRNRRGTRRGSR